MLYFHDKIRINVSIFGTFFFFFIPDQVQVLKDTPFFMMLFSSETSFLSFSMYPLVFIF